MAVYKRKECAACKYRQNDQRPAKDVGACPRCGAEMHYSDCWYISYTVGGKKYVRAVGPSRRMAEDAYAKVRVDVREGRFFDKAPSVPWGKAVKSFRKWFEANTEPRTAAMYENSLKILAPYFDHYTLDKIAPAMVEAFKAERLATVTNSTANRDIATLKRLMSLAEEWGLVEENRLRKVKKLKENASRVRFLTKDEIAALLAACGERSSWLKTAVIIALNTGLRRESILTLRWPAIDMQRRIITAKGKGGKVVKIPLMDTLIEALKAHKGRQKIMSQWVFPSPRDAKKPVHLTVHKAFQRALVDAGIKDFRFHDLRHTFASHFLMSTGDLKTLQEVLGHSDIKLTMRYSHLLDEHKRCAMEIFESQNQLVL